MKSVLISIQPKWCELIAIGKKTIEVRKTAPKLKTPFKCYIYCTQDKRYELSIDCLHKVSRSALNFGEGKTNRIEPAAEYGYYGLNGKVIGEFVCDRIYEAIPDYEPYLKNFFNYDFWDENGLLIDDCLSAEQKENYGHGKTLYGWHISNLKIYDKPKELGEFYTYKEVVAGTCKNKDCNKTDLECYKCLGVKPITPPPQSWCYVEEKI